MKSFIPFLLFFLVIQSCGMGYAKDGIKNIGFFNSDVLKEINDIPKSLGQIISVDSTVILKAPVKNLSSNVQGHSSGELSQTYEIKPPNNSEELMNQISNLYNAMNEANISESTSGFSPKYDINNSLNKENFYKSLNESSSSCYNKIDQGLKLKIRAFYNNIEKLNVEFLQSSIDLQFISDSDPGNSGAIRELHDQRIEIERSLSLLRKALSVEFLKIQENKYSICMEKLWGPIVLQLFGALSQNNISYNYLYQTFDWSFDLTLDNRRSSLIGNFNLNELNEEFKSEIISFCPFTVLNNNNYKDSRNNKLILSSCLLLKKIFFGKSSANDEQFAFDESELSEPIIFAGYWFRAWMGSSQLFESLKDILSDQSLGKESLSFKFNQLKDFQEKTEDQGLSIPTLLNYSLHGRITYKNGSNFWLKNCPLDKYLNKYKNDEGPNELDKLYYESPSKYHIFENICSWSNVNSVLGGYIDDNFKDIFMKNSNTGVLEN